jgi:hypothetical protein
MTILEWLELVFVSALCFVVWKQAVPTGPAVRAATLVTVLVGFALYMFLGVAARRGDERHMWLAFALAGWSAYLWLIIVLCFVLIAPNNDPLPFQILGLLPFPWFAGTLARRVRWMRDRRA